MAEMKLFQVYMNFFINIQAGVINKRQNANVFAFCNLCGLDSNRQCYKMQYMHECVR